jgi:hypothetical protein
MDCKYCYSMIPEVRTNIQRFEWTERLSVHAAAIGEKGRLYCWIFNDIPLFGL